MDSYVATAEGTGRLTASQRKILHMLTRNRVEGLYDAQLRLRWIDYLYEENP